MVSMMMRKNDFLKKNRFHKYMCELEMIVVKWRDLDGKTVFFEAERNLKPQ